MLLVRFELREILKCREEGKYSLWVKKEEEMDFVWMESSLCYKYFKIIYCKEFVYCWYVFWKLFEIL